MMRHRTPFKAHDDGDADTDDRVILDEQEQDELVDSLRSQNELRNLEHTRMVQLLIFMSTILQFVFFIGSDYGSSWTPLSPILASTSYPTQPLIPFARFWTLLNLAHHVHTIISIDAIRPTLHDPLFSWDQHRSWPITAIPLVLSLLLRPHDVAQCAWWSVPLLMAGLCILVTKWNNDGRAELMRLEALKYEAKGA